MHRITIQFPLPQTPDLIHRVRNFAEDLYHKIEVAGMGTVPDIDGVTDQISIEIAQTRHIGVVATIVNKERHRHGFETDAVVTRS